MVVGFCKLKLALVAANALEARSRANPMTRPLETVANFIAAPFSFPKSRRKTVGAARLATAARKHLCSPTNRLKCWRRGCASQVKSLRCRDGGFLTWAAKPSVRESPNPAKIFGSKLARHFLRWPFPTLIVTHSPRSKFPECGVRLHFLGRSAQASGSKNLPRTWTPGAEHRQCVLCSSRSAGALLSEFSENARN